MFEEDLLHWILLLNGEAMARAIWTTRNVAEVRTVLEDGVNKCNVTMRCLLWVGERLHLRQAKLTT